MNESLVKPGFMTSEFFTTILGMVLSAVPSIMVMHNLIGSDQINDVTEALKMVALGISTTASGIVIIYNSYNYNKGRIEIKKGTPSLPGVTNEVVG